MYSQTNLLVASMLLDEAASLLDEGSTELDLKVCDILVKRAKAQLGD